MDAAPLSAAFCRSVRQNGRSLSPVDTDERGFRADAPACIAFDFIAGWTFASTYLVDGKR
jgi:hypothetical protein